MSAKWMGWAIGGAGAGVSEAQAILFKIAYDVSTSDKDKNGKTVSGSLQANTVNLAKQWMPNLTEEQLTYLKSNYWKS